MSLLSSLNNDQKKAIALLQVGTFLEYFDLMLYVHMAVLLNELFFPASDPHTTSILTAFALCSSLAFRPIGALIFGWIGDHLGRKPTIIITTSMMAISCVVMATLPTYAQIGIVAAWIVTFCRIAQGISSMGESVGAEIYLTESIELPARYPAVAFVSVSATLGGLFALGVAFFVMSFSLNWRFAFWGGAFIAIIGAISRTYLRETPKFLEMKREWLKKEIHEANLEGDPLYGVEINATWKEPVNGKTLVSYFFVSCGTALCFYLAFIYFNPILKESFGYSSEDIIKHNFFLALVSLISNVLVAYLSYQIHPIKINKIRGILSAFVMLSIPFLLINLTSPTQLFLIQVLILIFPLDDVPASAVYMSHFPLYRRFTYATLLFSIARASVYVITAVGVIYLEVYFGSFGLWFITLPAVFGYLCSMRHFEGLERKFKLYPNLSYK